MCEPKRRFQEQNETGVRIGLQAYVKFYQYSQDASKTKTFAEFAKSPYYKAFIKFGRYCVGIRAINIPRFVEYVIHNNKKLDYWTSDSLYDEYLLDFIYKEHPVDALARAIEESIVWSEENDADAKDMLRYGQPGNLCHKIVTGRISAWVLFNSTSGQNFLAELNQEQQQMIWQYIDPEKWEKAFAKYDTDYDYVKTMLIEAGW